MSDEKVKVLVPFPVNLENSQAESSTNFLHNASKEKIITSNNDGQVWLESETEDDFFSVQGELSESCSNGSSGRNSLSDHPPLLEEEEDDSTQQPNPATEIRKLSELFEDLSRNEQVHRNHTKLFEFLQDEFPVALSARTADERLKSKQQILYLSTGEGSRENLKMGHKIDRNPNGCCFPRLSPRQKK